MLPQHAQEHEYYILIATPLVLDNGKTLLSSILYFPHGFIWSYYTLKTLLPTPALAWHPAWSAYDLHESCLRVPITTEPLRITLARRVQELLKFGLALLNQVECIAGRLEMLLAL